MTLEELYECDADTLGKLTPEELHKHFSQYLTVTRPELAEKPKSKQRHEVGTEPPVKKYLSPEKQKALELLQAQGFDFSSVRKKYK